MSGFVKICSCPWSIVPDVTSQIIWLMGTCAASTKLTLKVTLGGISASRQAGCACAKETLPLFQGISFAPGWQRTGIGMEGVLVFCLCLDASFYFIRLAYFGLILKLTSRRPGWNIPIWRVGQQQVKQNVERGDVSFTTFRLKQQPRTPFLMRMSVNMLTSWNEKWYSWSDIVRPTVWEKSYLGFKQNNRHQNKTKKH